MNLRLIVIAKEPIPGLVKTRLCPPCEPQEAALIAEACLRDTLAAVADLECGHKILALDGSPGDWLPAGFGVITQRGSDLGDRLTNAFMDVGGPCLLVGMDTPQLTPALLRHAMGCLLNPRVDAVLGPTVDGGWWALGVKRPHPRMFESVPMSTPQTYIHQRRRLSSLGLRIRALPVLRDVDHFADARLLASAFPHLKMARSVSALPHVEEPASA